jgi:type I restriction enzyme, S subunit
VPFVSPTEQRRIVEILDQANALRKKRAEADAKAARILPALFYKIFGDPATNPMGWESATLGDVIVDSQYGTSVRADAGADGLLILRMNNIQSDGELDLADLKFVSLDKRETDRQLLAVGDILFNRTNSRELVGKTGIWDDQLERAVAASYLIRVRVNEQRVRPRFVWAWMNMPFFKRLLEGQCRHAIGMANINATELRRFPLLIPALERQIQFEQIYAALTVIRSAAIQIHDKLELLFQALLHRAFSGQLTAKWREAHMKELRSEIEHQTKALSSR